MTWRAKVWSIRKQCYISEPNLRPEIAYFRAGECFGPISWKVLLDVISCHYSALSNRLIVIREKIVCVNSRVKFLAITLPQVIV